MFIKNFLTDINKYLNIEIVISYLQLFMPSYRRSNTFSVKPTENQSRRELCSAISSTFSDSQRASDVSSVISGSSSEDGSSLLGPILATSPPHPESTPDPLQHVPELPIKQRSVSSLSPTNYIYWGFFGGGGIIVFYLH